MLFSLLIFSVALANNDGSSHDPGCTVTSFQEDVRDWIPVCSAITTCTLLETKHQWVGEGEAHTPQDGLKEEQIKAFSREREKPPKAMNWEAWEERFEYGIRLGDDEGLPYKGPSDIPFNRERCTFDVRDATNISMEEFEAEYVQNERPVLLKGAVHSLGWTAVTKWQSLQAMSDNYGDHRVAFLGQNLTVDAVVKRIERMQAEGASVALNAGHGLVDQDLSFKSSVQREYYPLPDYLDHGNIFPQLYHLKRHWKVQNSFSPSYMVLGGVGAGTPFHKDGWDTPFWNACVSGGKHWVVFDRALQKRVDSDTMWDWSEITNHAFLDEVYPNLNRWGLHYDECFQDAGDIVWVPGGWYHTTLNTADSVSVTENQINPGNIETIFSHICYRDFGNESPSYEEASHITPLVESVHTCVALNVLDSALYNSTCCSSQQYLDHLDRFPSVAPFYTSESARVSNSRYYDHLLSLAQASGSRWPVWQHEEGRQRSSIKAALART